MEWGRRYEWWRRCDGQLVRTHRVRQRNSTESQSLLCESNFSIIWQGKSHSGAKDLHHSTSREASETSDDDFVSSACI